ncbi:hypothetical protein [Salmonella phage NINP13076]|uniref:Uncharacterized protein n=1 Tax=Salmonella phage SalP219 TaxID=3158864 RepID=A0AAU7PKL3_9CAUD|nr:hypothetical protein [Salmonella phage NINP13076]
MELANKFFFLAGVTENAKCDFRRFDDKTLLTFCHINDTANGDRLEVTIRTESTIDHATQKPVKDHYVAYTLENSKGYIKQAESLPIRLSCDVFGVVVVIVNDVFGVDIDTQIG